MYNRYKGDRDDYYSLSGIVFIPVAVNTSGREYDDFLLLFFLYDHRDTSPLTGELSEESDRLRCLRVVCLSNLQGSVGLI